LGGRARPVLPQASSEAGTQSGYRRGPAPRGGPAWPGSRFAGPAAPDRRRRAGASLWGLLRPRRPVPRAPLAEPGSPSRDRGV